MMDTIVPRRVMTSPVSGHGVDCPVIGGADVVVGLEVVGTDDVAGGVGEEDSVRGGETGFG